MGFGIEMTILGLVVGFLVGLTGVGGAALLTPIMIMLGVPATIAVGTDLFYNAITKMFGAIQHFRQKTINLKLVKFFAIGSIPGAITAIGVLQLFENFFQNQESIIRTALGVMLIIIALATIFRQIFDKKWRENRWQKKPLEEKKMLTIAIGFILGFVVGLTSIGSGSLFALALIYLYRLKGSEIVGTDIAHALLLVSVAGFLHAGLGNVDYLLTLNLLLGSIPGVLIGSTLSAKVPTKPLRTILATIILLSGIKMI
ncbi:sulfite exporter TauE/SafE family protein [Chengkuizengella marina]|nr:sulfite exporter TauE/SafE family protein [Chengkuizengella marina]